MIIEIIGAFRKAMAAIIESIVNTTKIVLNSFVEAARIFKTQAGTANPVETFTVVILFAFIGYFIYKFLWGSAKTFSIFLGLIIFLFVLTVILV
ncbi:MAG: hypothetical protein KAI53_05565 [Candidatus Aenigmarchaeota archaeon]|nr:hypothetical protein [Candidatus Aenigmarchaeota archaeon]